jgi:hypothetical protein
MANRFNELRERPVRTGVAPRHIGMSFALVPFTHGICRSLLHALVILIAGKAGPVLAHATWRPPRRLASGLHAGLAGLSGFLLSPEFGSVLAVRAPISLRPWLTPETKAPDDERRPRVRPRKA